MILIYSLAVCTLTSYGSAQLFPFSNLKAYFDHQTKHGPGNGGTLVVPDSEDRPYRHAVTESMEKITIHVPSLIKVMNEQPIESIENEEQQQQSQRKEGFIPENHRFQPASNFNQSILRHRKEPIQSSLPISTEKVKPILIKSSEVSTLIPPKNQYFLDLYQSIPTAVNIKQNEPISSIELLEQPPSKPVLKPIYLKMSTFHPKPSVKQRHHRKPFYVTPPPPTSFNSAEQSTIKFPLRESSPELTIVESIPALSVAIQPSNYGGIGGLVDYLTPPQLPSVYNVNHYANSVSKEHTREVPKLKSPTYRMKQENEEFQRIVPRKTNKKNHETPKLESIKESESSYDWSEKSNQFRPVKTSSRRPGSKYHNHKIPEQVPEESIYSSQQIGLDYNGAKQMDEQITAETSFSGVAAPYGSGQRVEFQLHGQKGPDTYKFGYDTGKGHDRQFRFEEKDQRGHVKGHYGFYGKDGQLQIVNYEADEHGFHAEPHIHTKDS